VPYDGKPGLNHLGYEVGDVAALQVRMKEAGYTESTVSNDHPYRKRVYFHDAEGNDWEFIQYFSADPAERNDYELPDQW
jgi:catechol 2,3-dioxygenase-like lactoylglutathione lyase family enzyme